MKKIWKMRSHLLRMKKKNWKAMMCLIWRICWKKSAPSSSKGEMPIQRISRL